MQSARESARATQCRNNLKQLGLGLQSYGNNSQRFPPGADHRFVPQITSTGATQVLQWTSYQTGRMGSFLVHLLPHLGQQTLYGQCNPSVDTVMQSTMPDGSLVASVRIPFFLCPSDASMRPINGNPYYRGAVTSMQGKNAAPSNYAVSMGSQAFSGPFPGN